MMGKNRSVRWFAILALSVGAGAMGISLRAGADVPKEAAKADAANPGFAALSSLSGTWVSTGPAKDGEKPGVIIFKVVSGGSAIMESMFPGTDREMVNMYTTNNDGVMMTHYCAMGNQPHLRLASANNGVLKFEFVDAGNLKSRDTMHMDSLEIVVKDDTLTENWTSYSDGKATGTHSFEFKRAK